VNALVHILAAGLLGLFGARVREKAERLDFLAELTLGSEKSRMRRLIQNVFPATVGKQLLEGQAQATFENPSASVLFVDLVGFTAWSKNRSSQEVVEHVTGLFYEFDLVLESFGIEKIKTIGDGYLAVANVPDRIDEGALKAVMAAIQIRKTLEGSPIGCRIGVATGAITGGVVPLKRSTFDVWGSTVNLSSRLESSAQKNEIRVCSETARQIGAKVRVSGPHEIELKGLGPTPYFSVFGLPDGP
jgi:class 3 adenylate cyclase